MNKKATLEEIDTSWYGVLLRIVQRGKIEEDVKVVEIIPAGQRLSREKLEKYYGTHDQLYKFRLDKLIKDGTRLDVAKRKAESWASAILSGASIPNVKRIVFKKAKGHLIYPVHPDAKDKPEIIIINC